MSRPGPRRRTFLNNYWRIAKQYLKSRIGVAGLVIIVFFMILAIWAGPLSNNNPAGDYGAGAPLSVPTWATIFPQYSGYFATGNPIPPVGFANTADLNVWTLTGVPNGTVTSSISTEVPAHSTYPGSMQLNSSLTSNPSTASNPLLPGGQVFFSLSQSFKWTYKTPLEFEVNMLVDPVKMENVSAIYLNFILSNPTENFSLSSTQDYAISGAILIPTSAVGTWHSAVVTDSDLEYSGLPGFATGLPTHDVFNTKGTYELTIQVEGVPVGAHSFISVDVASAYFHVDGNAYGILGTDSLGRDVWAQFVWGSRVSFEIGVLSGIGAVGLGTLAGIVAGYLGGLWDELLSRFTDFFLVLPFLPLLIIVVIIFGENPVLRANIYFWVIMIFAILTWPSIAKIIRSQVLSVKERQYVEASRAVGGGTFHILRKHILPNVMGLVYSQVALNVSGFILLEAALDFLAVSVTPVTTVSWGRMLTNALPYATRDSAAGYVWWWFLPPGIAIAALSLAFVLVGFALDSIFNPRLRAR